MDRRRLLVSMVAVAFATRTRAQAERVRTLGILAPSGGRSLGRALAPLGWVEGRNLRVEIRRVAPDGSDADAGAASLVRTSPDVLFGQGYSIVTALARASRSIPIVCGGISDPVEAGIARNLQRPGGNVTGLSYGLPEAARLQIGTFKTLVPGLARVIFVTTPGERFDRPDPAHEAACAEARLAGEVAKVGNADALDRLMGSMRRGVDAAWVALLPSGTSGERAAGAAMKNGIATHARHRDHVRAGMLFSYWISHSNQVGRVASIIDKVLRGEDPAGIPFEQPDKTDLTVNRATAKALGIGIPAGLQMRATEIVG